MEQIISCGLEKAAEAVDLKNNCRPEGFQRPLLPILFRNYPKQV